MEYFNEQRDRWEQLDDFTTAYIECALWSTNDESTPAGGVPLDENYGIEDFAPETLNQIIADCRLFQIQNKADIISADSLGFTRAGHDFWLTRNGHGAGFWDGDWPEEIDDRLTEASAAFGEFNLYVGDSGQIYH